MVAAIGFRMYNHSPAMMIAKEKAVIVNADDFGLSEGISEGILRAATEGILTSTTIQANQPLCEKCLRFLKSAPTHLGVGVHLTINGGRPLSIAGQALADENGKLSLTASQTFLTLFKKPSLLAAAEAEFEAQITWALDHGIKPTHLDSHRHSHAYPPLFKRVVRLAKKYNIPFIRQYGEKFIGEGWPGYDPRNLKAHRILNFFGWYVAHRWPSMRGTIGTWGVLQTGRMSAEWLVRAAQAATQVDGVVEIMTHPGLTYDLTPQITRMRDSRREELDALTNPAVKEAFHQCGIKLINYRDLLNFVAT
ncbi:MAG TPA: ChbG/HpnK family deacetylase [Phycisphaerae bacterium]|nr:ChbG/HpnK family deacetylase [Phycisphaerae bacterium]HPS53587.1 ChbG/HpnK family deacetylase [Phycisphaerae bacterium]